jgi:hypothetical protein
MSAGSNSIATLLVSPPTTLLPGSPTVATVVNVVAGGSDGNDNDGPGPIELSES